MAELEASSGLQLSSLATWKYPTPAALSRHLAQEITRGEAPTLVEERSGSAADELERLLAQVEQMDDDEVARAIQDDRHSAPEE